MATAPRLTSEQTDALLARALTDPQAAAKGFSPPGPDGLYGFSLDSGDGSYSAGDAVTKPGLQAAADLVMESRGNAGGGDPRIISAYRDMLRNAPDNWSSSTALTLAAQAPLLQAMEMLKGADD